MGIFSSLMLTCCTLGLLLHSLDLWLTTVCTALAKHWDRRENDKSTMYHVAIIGTPRFSYVECIFAKKSYLEPCGGSRHDFGVSFREFFRRSISVLCPYFTLSTHLSSLRASCPTPRLSIVGVVAESRRAA